MTIECRTPSTSIFHRTAIRFEYSAKHQLRWQPRATACWSWKSRIRAIRNSACSWDRRRAGPGDVDASRPYWPYFGGNTLQKTVGNSNYNALEVNLRHTSKRAELLIGYTYSKSIDDSSNLGEAVDPFNLGYTRAISAFDMKHNFVATYRYDLPFAQLFHRQNEMTRGWSLSGTTRFLHRFARHAI